MFLFLFPCGGEKNSHDVKKGFRKWNICVYVRGRPQNRMWHKTHFQADYIFKVNIWDSWSVENEMIWKMKYLKALSFN